MPEWLTSLLESPGPALLDFFSNLWWLLGLILAALIWAASRLKSGCNKQQLQDWCNQLGYDNGHVRDEAKERLMTCGGRAVPLLMDVLAKEGDKRRSLAVEALCEIGTPALKPLLAARNKDHIARSVDGALEEYLPKVVEHRQYEREHASMWKRFWNRLARTERIVDRLIALLNDGDPFVQEGAALALGRYSQPVVASELGRKIYPTECKDSKMREIVAQSMGQTKRAEAIPYLKVGLRDRSRDVRLAACQALRHFNQPEAMHALEDVLLPDENLSVQKEAARALGSIGSRESIHFLERVQAVLSKDGDHSELCRVVGHEIAHCNAIIRHNDLR